MDDNAYMRLAIELAERGTGRVSPNPLNIINLSIDVTHLSYPD